MGSASIIYFNIFTIPGKGWKYEHFRDWLKNFTIHGEPDYVEIYVDGSPTYQYNEDLIIVSLPESIRNTKFSNITISVPAKSTSYSVLILCEVQVYLGKWITCREKWTDTLVGLDFNDPDNNIKVMSSLSVYLTTRFLGKLSYVCTVFNQNPTTARPS